MVNIPGVLGIVVFYILILGVGIWAARRSKKQSNTARSGDGDLTQSENVMLAGRDIGLFVGVFTMTATWVGGGYINGTAEAVYNPGMGLFLAQAPIGYALSLIVGGLFFANTMRSFGYVTMLDPFQLKYGKPMCGLLFIPALLGEIFWTAAILSALGATIAVVIGLDGTVSVIISTCIVVLYTLFGGLLSVAYTDVVQLFCIFIGLWLSVPFAMTHKAVTPITTNSSRWIGSVAPEDALIYTDDLLMLILGGIPWQVYFQRVLSTRTARGAQMLSFMASFGCLVMAVPSILIGAVAANANWTAVGYNNTVDGLIIVENRKLVLPLVLQYLCPPAVSFVGLGAISAAVMSSADSSIFSAASMFARNVAHPLICRRATEKQILWVMRVAILGVGSLACAMGILVHSIYELWFLCSDLVYVILFPQLVSVLYMPFTNTYGSLAGYLFGFILRLSAGEKSFGIPTVPFYPGFNAVTEKHRVPFKTVSMLGSLITSTCVSFVMHRLWLAGKLEGKLDVFKCMGRDAPQPRTIAIAPNGSTNQLALVFKGPPNSADKPLNGGGDGEEEEEEEDEISMKEVKEDKSQQ